MGSTGRSRLGPPSLTALRFLANPLRFVSALYRPLAREASSQAPIGGDDFIFAANFYPIEEGLAGGASGWATILRRATSDAPQLAFRAPA